MIRHEEHTTNMADPALAGSSAAIRGVLSLAATVAKLRPTPIMLAGGDTLTRDALAGFIRKQSGVNEEYCYIHEGNAKKVLQDLLAALSEEEEVGHPTGKHRDLVAGASRYRGSTFFVNDITQMNRGDQSLLEQVVRRTWRRDKHLGGRKPLNIWLILGTASDPAVSALGSDGSLEESPWDGAIEIRVPTLSERRDDVVPIILAMVKRYSGGARTGEPGPEFSSEALRLLARHEWSDTREIRDAILQCVEAAKFGGVIRPVDLRNVLPRREWSLARPESGVGLPALLVHVDPGTAPPEDVAEVLAELSILYRRLGGAGITFSPDGTLIAAHEVVR